MTRDEIQHRWDAATRQGDDDALITLVCNDVLDYPRESMDVHLTPFATIRDLVGGPPPRLIGRQRYRANLIKRVAKEIVQQRAFVARLAEVVDKRRTP